jgi:hypothetical protein
MKTLLVLDSADEAIRLACHKSGIPFLQWQPHFEQTIGRRSLFSGMAISMQVGIGFIRIN